MAGLGLAGGLALVGTFVSAVGTLAAGQSRKKQADYEAAQLENQAKEERAAAQQEGFEIARTKRLALSRNQAVSAASGLSATDSGSLDLMGDIEGYGTWQEQIAKYGGDSRAEGLKASAEGARRTGRAAVTASFIDAASTIAGGASSFFTKYGGGGASTNTARSYRYG